MYSTRLNNSNRISHPVDPQVPLSLLQLLVPPDNLLDSLPNLLPLLDHTHNKLNVMHMAKTLAFIMHTVSAKLAASAGPHT